MPSNVLHTREFETQVKVSDLSHDHVFKKLSTNEKVAYIEKLLEDTYRLANKQHTDVSQQESHESQK